MPIRKIDEPTFEKFLKSGGLDSPTVIFVQGYCVIAGNSDSDDLLVVSRFDETLADTDPLAPIVFASLTEAAKVLQSYGIQRFNVDYHHLNRTQLIGLCLAEILAIRARIAAVSPAIEASASIAGRRPPGPAVTDLPQPALAFPKRDSAQGPAAVVATPVGGAVPVVGIPQSFWGRLRFAFSGRLH